MLAILVLGIRGLENPAGTFAGRGMALVTILSRGPVPAVFVLADPYPAVDKAAFTGFNAPGGYVTQNKGRRQHDKPFAGQNIAVHHAADGYHGSGNAAPHPRLFAYHNPAFRVEVSPQKAVYPDKAPGSNVAGNKGTGPNNRVYREIVSPAL
jgi:hypothetical protein